MPSDPAAPTRGWPGRLAGLLRHNLIFSVALVLAVVPRVLAMLGYRPAVLIRLDSYFYLLDATRSQPDPDNVGGYAFFLRVLQPLHSLAAIAAVQHLIGLGIAVAVYVILRRNGVPRWAGTLGALPVLFDGREIFLEHAVMADTLATGLMLAAFAVLLTRRSPSVWRSATAGLLMGVSGLTRPTNLPLIILMALFLLIQRVGWRRAGAVLLAGLLPVAGYVAWFYSAFGAANLTNSSGLFLWARTTSFANCKIIKPPADLLPLCPDRNPALPGKPRPNPYDTDTLLQQQTPQDFLWTRTDWPWRTIPSGYAPYQAAFTPAKNKLAQKFAIRAIRAQPLDYARTVADGVALTFLRTDYTWRFPVLQPYATTTSSPRRRAYEQQVLQTYLGHPAGRLGSYLGRRVGTMLYQPESKILVGYERVAYLPGLVFALAFVIGLGGMVIRRRGGPALLLWVSGVVLLVLPIAENQFNYRYALPTVPLACMAAILAVARRRAEDGPGASAAPAAGSAAAAASAPPAEPAPAGVVTAVTAAPAAQAATGQAAAGQGNGAWARTKSGLPIRKRPAGSPPAETAADPGPATTPPSAGS